MKIGYFVERFPYHSFKDRGFYIGGGGATVAYKLAIGIAKRGHVVSVFTTNFNSKSSIENYGNISIYRYGTNFELLNRNLSLGMFLKPLKHDVNIVHTHVGSSPMDIYPPLLYIRKKKKPLIVSSHADIGSYSGIARKVAYYFYYRLINEVLSHADIIISPSESYAKESLLKNYKEKVVVIPNGVNPEEFNIEYPKSYCRDILGLPFDKKIILYVGGLVQRKGLNVVIKSMPEIVKSISNVELIIVGEGSMREALTKLARDLKVSKYVKFVGLVENSEKVLYFKSADVFVLPSLYEVFGIVNLEAMACGIPIIASNVGGIPEVVKDGKNGILVPPRNSKSLSDAIIYLLENEDIREKMGKNGMKEVKKYSWDKIAEMTEKVYKEVVR